MISENLFPIIVLLSLTGAFIGLDRRAVFQGMFSQPLVAGSIIGLVGGDLQTGVAGGLMISLLYLNFLPLGSTIPPDETLLAIAVSSVSIITRLNLDGVLVEETVSLSLLLLIPIAYSGIYIDYLERRLNTFFSRSISRANSGDIERKVTIFHFASIMLVFFIYFGILILIIPLFSIIESSLFVNMGKNLRNGLENLFYIVPLLGFSVTILQFNPKKSKKGFVLSFLITLIALELLTFFGRG